MSLDIATRVEQDIVVVDVGKSFDFRNASAFKTKCQQHVDQGIRHVVIDFTRANILDSTALGALFSIYRQISPRDGQMVLVGARGAVAHVIELTKLDRVFELYATVDEALAALS